MFGSWARTEQNAPRDAARYYARIKRQVARVDARDKFAGTEQRHIRILISYKFEKRKAYIEVPTRSASRVVTGSDAAGSPYRLRRLRAVAPSQWKTGRSLSAYLLIKAMP